MITSTKNDQVKAVIELKKKARARNEQGLFVVEGVRMAAELPKNQVKSVYVSETFAKDPANAAFLAEYPGYELVSDQVFAAMSDTQTPQGVLALVRQFSYGMDEILKTKEYSKEQEGITKLGENHVFYLPYLMGERSPHNDPKARATFIGMSMDTTREEMTQAVLEGVAFGLRDSLEVARSLGIKIERTKICGGGAKSPLWKKIIANVMNLKVDVIESEEGPGYGGAMLAAVGCGEYESVQEAADKLVKVVDTVEPDEELVAKYEAKYQQFRKIYPALKDVFQKFD